MANPTNVVENRGNRNETVVHVARALGRSPIKRAVFQAVYRGKKLRKSVAELAGATGYTRKQVLDAAKPLAKDEAFTQERSDKTTWYLKDHFVDRHKKEILQAAGRPQKIASIPTKSNVTLSLNVGVTGRNVSARQLTIDDVDSFARVKRIRRNPGERVEMPEKNFKLGIQSIVGEVGDFPDWGGEKGDLYTTRLRLKGKRVSAAFAFKGPGERGILTPGRMGKNGDQIASLFETDSIVFLVQHWRQVAASVHAALRTYATAKSLFAGQPIYYGVIDGADSARLVKAYPDAFSSKEAVARG